MRDYSNDLTEEKLQELERRIAKVYREAWDDLKKTVIDYFAKFEKRDEEMRQLVEAGEFSEEEYRRWRLTQMGRGERFDALAVKMAERYTDANAVANSYVNDMTPGIYSLNRNYEAYQIEKTVGNCDFTLFDESTVRRLIVEQPDIMPYYPASRALRRGIDLAYGKSQITKRVTSGIIRGLSPGKIANELMQSIAGMSRESAVRAARTGITAAQNAGRMDSYAACEKMGIAIRRQWIATKDFKTRAAHGLADGQIVEGTDTPFVVDGEKLLFPCDTSCGASGRNIYNCRCRMRTVENDGIEAEPRQMRVRNPATGKYELVNEMTYSEWVEWKKSLAQDKQTVAFPSKSGILEKRLTDREETAVNMNIRTPANVNPEIHDVGTIDISRLTREFGEIRTNRVIVTDERIQHVKDHHPLDFELFEQYGKTAVENPNEIIRDLKNDGTVFYVKHLDETNLNVIVRLVTQEDDQSRFNSIMTFYRLRDRNLKKLIEKNKLLYKAE